MWLGARVKNQPIETRRNCENALGDLVRFGHVAGGFTISREMIPQECQALARIFGLDIYRLPDEFRVSPAIKICSSEVFVFEQVHKGGITYAVGFWYGIGMA